MFVNQEKAKAEETTGIHTDLYHLIMSTIRSLRSRLVSKHHISEAELLKYLSTLK